MAVMFIAGFCVGCGAGMVLTMLAVTFLDVR